MDVIRLSKLMWDAREAIEMYADSIEGRRTEGEPYKATFLRALVVNIDEFRAEQGWSPDGFGGEVAAGGPVSAGTTVVLGDLGPEALAKPGGERLHVLNPDEPTIEPVDDGCRSRVAVGGPLHGSVLRVPHGTMCVYSVDMAEGFAQLSAAGPIEDGKRYRVTSALVLYRVRDRGKVGLLIHDDVLRSADAAGVGTRRGPGLDETIVDALGLAAGVHGVSPMLVPRLPAEVRDDRTTVSSVPARGTTPGVH